MTTPSPALISPCVSRPEPSIMRACSTKPKAWASQASAATPSSYAGIGIGRWIRLQDDPRTADAAVAVLDEFQGQGIGRALLRLLAEAAIDRGIDRFRGEVLADNEPMLALLERFGAVTTAREGPVLEVSLPLPKTLDELRSTWSLRTRR